MVWDDIRNEAGVFSITAAVHCIYGQNHEGSNPQPWRSEWDAVRRRSKPHAWKRRGTPGAHNVRTQPEHTMWEHRHENQHQQNRDNESQQNTWPPQHQHRWENEFKYLGSISTKDGCLNREIETRVQKVTSVSYQLAPLLRHPNIPIEIKAKLIESIFRPTLTCQSQTWTLAKSLERKITTCEMRV